MSELKRYIIPESDGLYEAFIGYDRPVIGIYRADKVDAEIAKLRAELQRAHAAVRDAVDTMSNCCTDCHGGLLDRQAQAIEESRAAST